MTRNFSDEWEASQHRADADENADVAPQRVQDDVSALLRGAAAEDVPAMPADVEARLRAALAAEFATPAASTSDRDDAPGHTPDEAPQRPATIMPLPGRSTTPAADTTTPGVRPLPGQEHTVAAPSPSAPVAGQPGQPGGAASTRGTNPERTGSHPVDPGVTSLADHRARKRSWSKPVFALGAAAAVAIGAVGVVKGMDHGSSSGDLAGGSATQSALTYDDRVHVTRTNTKYVSSSLKTQAAAMLTTKSPEINELQHEAQGLGAGTSKANIQACLNALKATANEKPDSVRADIGTYDGQAAIVVVVEKDGKKTVWVVNQTCTKASDKLAGPQTLDT